MVDVSSYRVSDFTSGMHTQIGDGHEECSGAQVMKCRPEAYHRFSGLDMPTYVDVIYESSSTND
jgi:hypothetical protein